MSRNVKSRIDDVAGDERKPKALLECTAANQVDLITIGARQDLALRSLLGKCR